MCPWAVLMLPVPSDREPVFLAAPSCRADAPTLGHAVELQSLVTLAQGALEPVPPRLPSPTPHPSLSLGLLAWVN